MLTITDLFAGAGGSSSGAERVPGVRVRIACNHWALAVETHATNLPWADHDVADISQVDPRRYPATDLLWASPSCTNHSQARGRRRDDGQPDLFGEILPDDAGERSRATMWDVPRFVEAMMLRGRPYRAFVVENVVDVRQWMFFPAWKTALRAAGYCLHEVFLNSMFAGRLGEPAPQSRDRWYCVGHLAAEQCPDLDRWTRPAAWCPTCEATVRAVQAWKRPDRPHGRYRAQYVYRCPNVACRNTEVHPRVLPAAVAIDWALAGVRIGDRVDPLAPATMRRIRDGLARYGSTALLVPAGGTWNDDARPVTEPMRTRTTRETEGVVFPSLLVPVEGRDGVNARPATGPMRTQTARLQDALVVPLRNNGVARPAGTHPLPTFAAAGQHHMLVSYYGNGSARPVSEPIATIPTKDRFALVSTSAPAVDDCTFRMLEPSEIKAGMAFTPGYTVLGNKRERVRQLGNAVTPPAARDLVAALVEAITGDHIEQTA
ncbi:MAG TPA: DNA cytosine methyltransferase [Mycobacteriales bacterium]